MQNHTRVREREEDPSRPAIRCCVIISAGPTSIERERLLITKDYDGMRKAHHQSNHVDPVSVARGHRISSTCLPRVTASGLETSTSPLPVMRKGICSQTLVFQWNLVNAANMMQSGANEMQFWHALERIAK
jgi:hypothetical protein